jgi:hypothetical protein
VLRPITAGLAVLLVAGCSGAGTEADGPSLDACGREVGHRTGQAVGAADPPWRVTSRQQGNGYVVNIWTQTPREAPRPSGAPNYVCVTERDRDADHGVRLVDVRP